MSIRNNSFPSLLDRLTNDDPILLLLNNLKREIEIVEAELKKCIEQFMPDSERSSAGYDEKQRELQRQLHDLKTQYATYDAFVSSRLDIRSCVKRDLEWLLNANRFFLNDEQENYPETACSVLNYGAPDLTGRTVSGLNFVQLERQLYQIIINYEPRIAQRTLSVKVVADPVKSKHNIFVFEIEGELYAKPSPVHLHLRTEFELENSQVAVYDIL